MNSDQKLLRCLWRTEMEILDVIHDVCCKNGLRYSLAFGTLIGAVRHGGFIPWDDDIDIIMPRSDYEKLISIWDETSPKGYILQHKDKDDDFEQNFVKIRKDQTTFLQDEIERTKRYHKGVFVDIAPCDRVAPTEFTRKIQYFACAISLLYSKEHTSGTGGVIGVIERILLSLPKRFRPAVRKKAEAIIARWDGNDKLACFCTDTIQNCRRYFPSDMLDDFRLTSYEGRSYFVIKKPDDFLRVRYGEYMELPPEDERRWKHHPIIIDFEHNYEELHYDKS